MAAKKKRGTELQRAVRRLEKRMSLREIARQIPMSAGSLWKIKDGRTKNPRWQTAKRLLELAT